MPLQTAPAFRIRPLRPDDRLRLVELFDGMSATSRHMRFLSPMPRLSDRTLRALLDVDATDHVAWIALRGGVCVGVARYVRDPGHSQLADLALAVADRHHRQGIGRALMEALMVSAASNGIELLTLDVHPENRAAIALFRSLGAELWLAGGLMAGRLRVAPPRLAAA